MLDVDVRKGLFDVCVGHEAGRQDYVARAVVVKVARDRGEVWSEDVTRLVMDGVGHGRDGAANTVLEHVLLAEEAGERYGFTVGCVLRCDESVHAVIGALKEMGYLESHMVRAVETE